MFKMNGLPIKCRVCWEAKETSICVKVSTKWAKDSVKTIKDVILLCVPWMFIKDDSYLCKPCLWQLKFTYDFIERCLKTENVLNEENNMTKFNLEDILENSLRNGNKIQIIFENRVSLQTDGSDDTDANFGKTVQGSDDITENINFKIRAADATIPPEHDYCIKKGTQIAVSVINNQQNSMKSEDQTFSGIFKKSLNNDEKENVFTANDKFSDNNTVFLSDSNAAEKNVSDPCDTDILRNILTTKKKLRCSKPVLIKTAFPITSQQAKLENELKALLDIAPHDFYFMTAYTEVSTQQQDDLVRDGVNILNMSKDPNKKKRTIYLSRDLWKGYHNCSKCKVTFTSRCDYMDHIHLHRRGKMKTPGIPIYTCKVCSETFAVDIEFRTHTKMLHGIPSPHECTKCKRGFKTNKMLKNHIEIFKDKDKCVFKCTRCNGEFSNRALLARHENYVKDAPCCNYKKCRVCFKKFTKEGFKIHCTEVHSNYLCSECGKPFLDSSKLATHRRNVHNAVYTMCHECGKILSQPKLLEHHIETVHGTGEKNYICDKCPRQFVCQRYLQKHMKVHLETTNTNINSRKWRCEQCGKNYAKKETLRQHMNMFHLGIRKYTCPICNEGFTRNDYLKRHIKAHEKYIRNTCTICRKSFGSDWRLEMHIFAGHDVNGKSLENGSKKRPPGLKNQLAFKKVRCVCKICNKVLANKSNLRKHYRAHLNLREAKCDICGVIFQGRLALNNHRKLHGNPNFQFSCNICHAYKSSGIELENHMHEVHKNKKYKCSLCPEEFGRKHLLHSHETIVHQEEIHKKEALYEMLQKSVILVPSDIVDVRRTNKGIKLGRLEVDVNTVMNVLTNENEDFEMAPGSSQGETSAGLYKNFVGNQTGGHGTAENKVIVLGNEY